MRPLTLKERTAAAAALRETARLLETGKMDFIVEQFDDPASPLTADIVRRLEAATGQHALFFDEVRLGGARDERVIFCCFAAAMAETGDL